MKFFSKYKQVIAGVILGFYTMAVILAYSTDKSKNAIDVLNSLGALISSAGAIAAIFTLVHVISEKREEERNKHISCANFLLVQLLSQAWVTREYIQKVFKNYDKGDAQACVNLVLNRYSVDHLRDLDLEKYAFLIGGYDSNVFTKLSNCKFNTAAITEYVDNRSNYYLSELVEPCKHMASSDGFILQDVMREVDPIVVHSLVTSTDRILHQLKITAKDLTTVHQMLYDVMKKKYPNETFIKPLAES